MKTYVLEIDGEKIREAKAAFVLAREAKILLKLGLGREARVYNQKPVGQVDEYDFTLRSLENENKPE